MESQILFNALRELFTWNKSRLECFAMIILGMISAESVNLAQIASHVKQSTSTKYDSIYKRIQNFFSGFKFSQEDVAKFIVKLFEFKSINLIIDRTNWWYGSKHINYLVLSIRYKNVAIKIFSMALTKCANSTAAQRIEMLKRVITCFGKNIIGDFCGDREFLCVKLLKYLVEENIPFTMRIKGGCVVKNGTGQKVTIKALLRDVRPGEIRIIRNIILLKQSVDVVAYIRGTELTMLATNHDLDTAQDRYINRNQIETMFKAMKTQGFNLEDTHITRPERLEKLMGTMAIAFAWAYKIGDYLDEINPIKIKSHGRRLRSVFQTGFKFLIRLLSNSAQRINELCAIIALIFLGEGAARNAINVRWL